MVSLLLLLLFALLPTNAFPGVVLPVIKIHNKPTAMKAHILPQHDAYEGDTRRIDFTKDAVGGIDIGKVGGGPKP